MIKHIYRKILFKLFRDYKIEREIELKCRLGSVGKNTRLDEDVVIHHPENTCIGKDCFIGKGVWINAKHGVSIGDGCGIAPGCKIITWEHGIDNRVLSVRETTFERKLPVKLEEGVWLGLNVIILPGVSLGRGVVVAAGAVVNRDFQDFSIIAGQPAKVIGNRKSIN